MCPLDGFLYYIGVTSEETFSFLINYYWHIIGIGIFLILASLAMFSSNREFIITFFKKISFKPPKLNLWRKRRMFFHFFIYSLIIFHITLTIWGITELRSLCPRSVGDFMIKGQFGASSVFWIIMLSMVIVWGRVLCGWLCVFAPVQEQSVNFLKTCGINPEYRKFKQTPLIYITTGVLWTSFLYNILININNLDYNPSYGYKVASYWIFLGGVITTIPLTMFFTYFFGGRWFCKYVCPIGGFQSLYSRFSLLKIKIDKSKCINCDACTKNCQMGVNISYISGNGINVSDGNCILCGDCIDKCPKKALSFDLRTFFNKKNVQALRFDVE